MISRQNIAYLAFNRGLVSALAMARVDLKRMALSAERMVNWMPRVLGSMMPRMGFGYLGATASNNLPRLLRFVFSINDKALIEITNVLMRVWVSDALITRPSVNTQVINGTFVGGIWGWNDDDEAGAISAWSSDGLVTFTGTGSAAAIRTQTLVIASGDQNVEHALRIVVLRGPITFRLGSTSGGDEYISETQLDTGYHSLAFTPTGASAYIKFSSSTSVTVRLGECSIEAAGVMTLPAPWAEADLGLLRYDQSGDIIYVAAGKTTDNIGYQQRQIERRASRSWSIVLYKPNDGPWRDVNTTSTSITPSGTSGTGVTLTATASVFKSTNVGGLWAVTQTGQQKTTTVTAQNTFSSAIIIDGGTDTRAFAITISGLSGTGTTITLQRSIGDTGTYSDVTTYTTDQTINYDDGLANQVVAYRIGCKTGDYSSGTIALVLYYASGTTRGICRIIEYNSETQVTVDVLSNFASTTASEEWEEGKWSDRRGWPTAVSFYEGRLWFAGRDSFIGSASDDFTNMDHTAEGDAAAINRTIGSGPVDTINWLLPMQRLLAGGQGAEFSARSTALDEPLTPSNFNLKRCGGQGSNAVGGMVVEDSGVYVQRGGIRVFELSFDGNKLDYSNTQLSILVPEIGSPGIVRMEVQRQPDTRLHFLRSDGTVAVVIFDKAEDVKCWCEIEAAGTDAAIKDIVVLPGDSTAAEDQVYYVTSRTINSSTVRYLERMALESEGVGGTLNKQADSFVIFTNSPASLTVSGLTHLVGQSVVVWQDGVCPEDTNGDPKTYTVSAGGTITLDTEATTGIVGLAYEVQWQSAKLAQLQGAKGSILNFEKNIRGLGLVLKSYHPKFLKFGQDFDNLDDLPSQVAGSNVDTDVIQATFDDAPMVFPGTWTSDARLCLEAVIPRPGTLLSAMCQVDMSE